MSRIFQTIIARLWRIANYVVVPDADRLINFTVEGGGHNAGVGNSDFFSDEHWDADGKSTFKGRCYLVVRSNRKAKKVTIRATAKGLPEQQVMLNVFENIKL